MRSGEKEDIMSAALCGAKMVTRSTELLSPANACDAADAFRLPTPVYLLFPAIINR